MEGIDDYERPTEKNGMKSTNRPENWRRGKTKVLQRLFWVVSVTWFAFLVFLSSQNGTDTGATSMRLASFIARLLHIAQDRIPELDGLLRKLAHFIGFLIFGGLVESAVQITWPAYKRSLLLVIPICSALAILDEVKKILISGRHLSWPEAGLNALGILCGALMAWGICWIVRQSRKRMDSNNGAVMD